MKRKEGRDYLELSDSIFSVLEDGRFRISGGTESISMTIADLERINKLVIRSQIRQTTTDSDIRNLKEKT
jgi:hypothetical protein